MKRISVLLIAGLLALAICAPSFAVARNLVNTAPAIGGKNGTFSCYQLANTTYVATALSLTDATLTTTGFIDPPAPAKITMDPAAAAAGADTTTITIVGTDHAGVAATETLSWTNSTHTPLTTTKWYKTITSFKAATSAATYPGATAVGYAAITQFYVPANTQWVDMQYVGTTAVLYVGFTSTAITLPLCSYVFPLLASTGPVTRQMGLSGGTMLYFGVSTTAHAADQLKIQCWK
jgi:hypothetical protein